MAYRSFGLRIVGAAILIAAAADLAQAMGGGGPPVSSMTRNYCRQTVANKGITDVARFEDEVKRCIDDPITYPTTDSKPRR